MIITTQFTADYEPKAILLKDSIKGAHRFEPILIDNPDLVQSYRKGWPTNRPHFVTMQAGEFIDYLDCTDKDVICCIDSDTVMQRDFTDLELLAIHHALLKTDFVSVYGAYPPTPLHQVAQNLGCSKLLKGWDYTQTEFTASIMIGRRPAFVKLLKLFLSNFDKMIATTGHHAANQLLTNLVVNKFMSVTIMGSWLQCGSWYDGVTKDMIDNTVFNHTK